jgi:hypothetical protein
VSTSPWKNGLDREASLEKCAKRSFSSIFHYMESLYAGARLSSGKKEKKSGCYSSKTFLFVKTTLEVSFSSTEKNAFK